MGLSMHPGAARRPFTCKRKHILAHARVHVFHGTQHTRLHCRNQGGFYVHTHTHTRSHCRDQGGFYVHTPPPLLPPHNPTPPTQPPPVLTAVSPTAAAVAHELGASSADSVLPMGPLRTSWGMGQVRVCVCVCVRV